MSGTGGGVGRQDHRRDGCWQSPALAVDTVAHGNTTYRSFLGRCVLRIVILKPGVEEHMRSSFFAFPTYEHKLSSAFRCGCRPPSRSLELKLSFVLLCVGGGVRSQQEDVVLLDVGGVIYKTSRHTYGDAV